MNTETILINWTEDEIRNNPFVNEEHAPAFYMMLGSKLCNSWDNVVGIDCRKIEVAKNIIDQWYETIPNLLGVTEADLSMCLLMSGPKQNDQLPANTVLLEKGAITPKTDEPCFWNSVFAS